MINSSLDSYPLVFNPVLAANIGLNEAIVLEQINYWVELNKNANRNFRDGFYWTYNSYKGWQMQFTWCSEATIKRTFNKLEKMELIITGVYNKEKRDRTKWYRVNYDAIYKFWKSSQFELNDRIKLTSPLPETNSETKNNIRKDHLYDLEISYDRKAAPKLNFNQNEFHKKDNIFSQITKDYGEERVRAMFSFVNKYIDELYPNHTEKKHPYTCKAKRMIFTNKLLECAEETSVEDEDVMTAVSKAVRFTKDFDPKIYLVTKDTVLGYWLIQDEELVYQVIKTKYAPVGTYY